MTPKQQRFVHDEFTCENCHGTFNKDGTPQQTREVWAPNWLGIGFAVVCEHCARNRPLGLFDLADTAVESQQAH